MKRRHLIGKIFSEKWRSAPRDSGGVRNHLKVNGKYGRDGRIRTGAPLLNNVPNTFGSCSRNGLGGENLFDMGRFTFCHDSIPKVLIPPRAPRKADNSSFRISIQLSTR